MESRPGRRVGLLLRQLKFQIPEPHGALAPMKFSLTSPDRVGRRRLSCTRLSYLLYLHRYR